jgi:hypothetical protein
LRKITVISIVPAAPLVPATAAVRLAAGHDRVVTAVVEVGVEVPAGEVVVVDPRPTPSLEDDDRAHPASASTAARTTAAPRRSVKS